MLLSQIEQAAAKGNLAAGGFNIRSVLRFEVIPEFYRFVGDVTWLRRPGSLTVSPGNRTPAARTYDLPRDFYSMISVGVSAGPLRYIGEDPNLVMNAELQQTASSPHGYYIVPSTAKKWRAIRFDAPSDIEYEVAFLYRSRLVIENDAEDLELDEYIPEDFQPALIHGLKRDIYLDRFGQGDQRYAVAAGKFDQICEEAKDSGHDLAQRNFAIFCD